jgi:pimeloyl-ACP methyl ester carboxylesterase
MSAVPRTYRGLPSGIDALQLRDVNGLDQHVLTAGAPAAPRGVVLLLHGFPELSFSWRHVMVPLAASGFFVVAPDQRGYGLTTGWDPSFDGDLESFSAARLVDDVLHLLDRLDVSTVSAVVGHDFGSLVAARAALMRADVFRSVVLMSAPVAPVPPTGTAPQFFRSLADGLLALQPPREHYQQYFSGIAAERDMLESDQGLAAFLRGYFHGKSGDWNGNNPRALAGGSPEDFAQLPAYYVMPAGIGMAQTVSAYYEDYERGEPSRWLPDDELSVYVDAFATSGFQGGLNWYRCVTQGIGEQSLAAFVGQPINVPAGFIAGERDWGIHQSPGARAAMQTGGCTDFRMLRLIEGAGHWVQQERPTAVVEALLDFFDR